MLRSLKTETQDKGISACRVVLIGAVVLVLLSARVETLSSRHVLFDENFDFHFYDLDLCRQAEQRGLRMGTWPLPIIHESGGDMHDSAWRSAYSRYIDKWGS